MAPAPKPVDIVRARVEPRNIKPRTAPAPQIVLLKDRLQRNLLHLSAGIFLIGCAGWCALIWNHFASPGLVEPAAAAYTVASKTDSEVGKANSFGMSSYVRIDHPPAPMTDTYLGSGEAPASIVAREWKLFAHPKVADRGGTPAKRTAKVVPDLKPAVRLASLESAPQSIPAFHTPTEAVPSHVRPPIGDQTALVDFETAPFPYHGMMGDSTGRS